MRIQRVLLKHHGHITLRRCLLRDASSGNHYITSIRLFESRYEPQGGGLASTSWAEQHNKTTVINMQGYVLDSPVAAKRFANTA